MRNPPPADADGGFQKPGGLFELDLAGLRPGGHLLGQLEFEHAVFIRGADFFDVDAGDVEAAREGAVAAFAADVAVLLLLLALGLVLGGDRKGVAVEVDLNVLLDRKSVV